MNSSHVTPRSSSPRDCCVLKDVWVLHEGGERCDRNKGWLLTFNMQAGWLALCCSLLLLLYYIIEEEMLISFRCQILLRSYPNRESWVMVCAGRVRVRAKGIVSLVLDNLEQKRKAHVRSVGFRLSRQVLLWHFQLRRVCQRGRFGVWI